MRRKFLFSASLIALLGACASEPDCDPNLAFDQARAGQEPEPLCQERDYAEAWQLGQALGELEAERSDLRNRIDQLDAGERMRLRVLERDIPELETLARIQGHMAPAELDD